MAIDPEEAKRIEDSLVYDKDEPEPEGAWVYLTARFVSKVVLAAYGIMLLGAVLMVVLVKEGRLIPASLKPEAVLIVSPAAVCAIFFYLSAGPDVEISKKRSWKGRLITGAVALAVMQVMSILLWLAIAKAFSLN